jgi:N-acetylneuraminic acid mutarotase
MKILSYSIILFFISLYNVAYCQTWSHKANYPDSATSAAVGFSIGTKGYIYSGGSIYGYKSREFWEWDQTTNIWMRKADFPGTIRNGSVGFSIGTKGYIVTGMDTVNGTYCNDFWEWDQAINTWSRKADFAGSGRSGAVGFSIGNKGYVGTGFDSTYEKNFWEWSQSTNTWVQKADLPGQARVSAIGFSIGNKGYIGTGNAGNIGPPNPLKYDFWEFDPATNTWTQKADFVGGGIQCAAAFPIGTRGYICTGNELWVWEQATNTWSQSINFPPAARIAAISFSIGVRGYVGLGQDDNYNLLNDFWEFCDTCSVGINELNYSQSIYVYPNPASNVLFVKSTDQSNKSLVNIYDIFGNMVYHNEFIGNCEINLSGIARGLYFVRISNNKFIYTKKIIIN